MKRVWDESNGSKRQRVARIFNLNQVQIYRAVEDNNVALITRWLNGHHTNWENFYETLIAKVIGCRAMELFDLVSQQRYGYEITQKRAQVDLAVAIDLGAFQIAVSLINRGVSLDYVDDIGDSYLCAVVCSGELSYDQKKSLISLLLNKGMRIQNFGAEEGVRTTLNGAFIDQDLKLIRLLVVNGEKIGGRNKYNAEGGLEILETVNLQTLYTLLSQVIVSHYDDETQWREADAIITTISGQEAHPPITREDVLSGIGAEIGDSIRALYTERLQTQEMANRGRFYASYFYHVMECDTPILEPLDIAHKYTHVSNMFMDCLDSIGKNGVLLKDEKLVEVVARCINKLNEVHQQQMQINN